MLVNCKSQDLSDALLCLQGSVAGGSARIGLKADCEGQRVELSTNDGIIAAFTELKGEVLENGYAFLPATILLDMVRELPKGDIHLAIKGGKFEIWMTKPSSFFLTIQIDSLFEWRAAPDLSLASAISLPAKEFSRMIEAVQFCISSESQKPFGTVGYLHKVKGESKLRLVGTDSFRLAIAELEVQNLGSIFSEDYGVCLTKRALREMARLAKESSSDILLRFSQKNQLISLASEKTKLYIILANVLFPRYEGVIPKSHTSRVILERDLVQKVAKRVMVAADRGHLIGISFDPRKNEGLFTSRTAGSTQSREFFNFQEGERASPISLHVNGRYFLEILGAMHTKDICVFYGESFESLVIEPVEEEDILSRYVLVPVEDTDSQQDNHRSKI